MDEVSPSCDILTALKASVIAALISREAAMTAVERGLPAVRVEVTVSVRVTICTDSCVGTAVGAMRAVKVTNFAGRVFVTGTIEAI